VGKRQDSASVNSALLLADAGNIGLILCAGIDTTAVTAYAIRARGGHGKWWATPVGLHLMLFMIAFAVVLDEAAFAIVMRWTGTRLPAWYPWLTTVSFVALIPPVLAWRLALILRPPR